MACSRWVVLFSVSMSGPQFWFRCAAGGLLAFGLGCVLNLDERACGDGYLASGEECDPLVPSSFENGCLGLGLGVAMCDPSTCRVIATPEQCAVCGDGTVDPERGEECDGDNLDGKACPLGSGSLQCRDCDFDLSLCDTCGNGRVEIGEECDSNAAPEEFVDPVSCAGLPPLVKDYTSGTVAACKDNCRWQRTRCGYCGNNELDGALPVDPDFEAILSTPEVCDGSAAPDLEALRQHCSRVCGSSLDLLCTFGCGDDCRSFDSESTALVDPECCRSQGETCPVAGEDFPCCWSLDHPGHDPGLECESIIDGGDLRHFCR